MNRWAVVRLETPEEREYAHYLAGVDNSADAWLASILTGGSVPKTSFAEWLRDEATLGADGA